MLIRLTLLLIVLALTACSSTKKSPKTEPSSPTTTTINSTSAKVITYQPNEKVSMDRFLQDAIATGLQRDQITTELAMNIANTSKYFVEKCKICDNVNKALQEHKGYTDASKMTGQAENALAIVKQADHNSEMGKDAFKKLVSSYVQHHFKYSKLTTAQKAKIEQTIAVEAKNGKMQISMYSFCPSCDGAEGACRKE